EWGVAVEDQDRSFISLQRLRRLLDRVSRTFLLRLMGDRDVAARERELDLVAALSDHHDALFRPERINPFEEVKKERAAGDRMQHLVRVRAHARSLPRSKDHDGKSTLF